MEIQLEELRQARKRVEDAKAELEECIRKHNKK